MRSPNGNTVHRRRWQKIIACVAIVQIEREPRERDQSPRVKLCVDKRFCRELRENTIEIVHALTIIWHAEYTFWIIIIVTENRCYVCLHGKV